MLIGQLLEVMRCCGAEEVETARLVRKQARAEERERRRRRCHGGEEVPRVDLRDWRVVVPAYGRWTEAIDQPVGPHLTADGAWDLRDAAGTLLPMGALVAGLRGPLGHVAARLWASYACPAEDPRARPRGRALCTRC